MIYSVNIYWIFSTCKMVVFKGIWGWGEAEMDQLSGYRLRVGSKGRINRVWSLWIQWKARERSKSALTHKW